MSISLIESKRASQKSVPEMLVSVGMHAAVITLAVYASASAGSREVVEGPTEIPTHIYPAVPAKPDRPPSPPRRSASATPSLPSGPVITAPITIPDRLPTVDPSGGLAPAESLFTIGDGDRGSSGAPTDGGVDSGSPVAVSRVEKPASPRPGNPFPKYPALLEGSRVEGTVLAQFVVDTLGRAEMSTFEIVASSNDLFSNALRSALVHWRFYPAEAGGHKVKQIVQLPLKFVAPN